ncbi:metalloregulator ArsR/SmtB family transcription factor [Nocardia sp. NPDC049707]|uniref:ArsR/SmtB family transcription factor n=1 Tax=Nocardia sp. NPDC049707 TaxID=3154735 RepID=UPI003424FA73
MESSNSGKAMVFDAFANVVKAMSSGRRLELIELLAQGEHSVDALARMTGITVTTVSSNLQTLKHAGLVATRRAGTTIYYRLTDDDVAELYVAAKKVALRHSPGLREAVNTYMAAADPRGVAAGVPVMTEGMTVVDVRPRIEFEAGHVPGAISIPLDELPDRYQAIPAGTGVLIYCRGEFCRLAREAAAWLCERGIEATAMDEGIMEWRVSGEVALDVV